jgi:hypothetical protein
MKTIPNDTLLKLARDTIEVVILRTQLDVAKLGPSPRLLNRIRDLSDAIDLIDPNVVVVDLMEYSR